MKVALADFGTGNLHSLARALEAGGADVAVTRDSAGLLDADAIVLPGVGAFGAAAHWLAATGDALRTAVRRGRPCLGICLGMQLLFDSSEEGPGTGLGVMAGRVRRLRAPRLPHMGWNEVDMAGDPLFHGLDELVVYYANSYIAEPSRGSDVIAWTRYGDDRFPAAVRRDSVWGVQFHPEKSGTAGLALIRNFLAQVPA
jgi:imidazole glycerol-phosphate synthase subunit HisH